MTRCHRRSSWLWISVWGALSLNRRRSSNRTKAGGLRARPLTGSLWLPMLGWAKRWQGRRTVSSLALRHMRVTTTERLSVLHLWCLMCRTSMT